MDKLNFPEAQTPQIQVESWSNSARILQIRGFTRDGTLSHDHTTSSDRSRVSTIFDVSDIPAMLQVSPTTAPVRRGECYVRITLLMAGFAVGRLIAGYVTDGATLAWPGGNFENFTDGIGLVRLVTGTNPAAGVAVVETVPTNARWRLRSLYVIFVTSATVASRVPKLLFNDGATQFHVITDLGSQTASVTRWFNYSLLGESRAGIGAPNMVDIRLPDFLLPQGYRIVTDAADLQADDDWGAPVMVVEEWIEE